MRYLFLILFIAFPATLPAQKQGQKLIDAHLKKLRKLKEDTNKVNILTELSASYASLNTTEGIKYGEQGLQLAERLGWKKGIAASGNSLGSNYLGNSDYATALKYFNKSLKINEELEDQSGISASLRNIAAVNVTQGAYTQALAHYKEALRIDEELEDKRAIARDLVSIGGVYQGQSNYALSLEYALKALKINEEIGDKSGIASNYGAIGMVYIGQGYFAQSLENYKKALKLYEELGNKRGVALSLKNVGNAYISLREFPKALEYYNQAIKMYEELGDKSGIARNLGNMGNVYQEQPDYPKALRYLLMASGMNDELGEKYPKANNLGSIGCLYLAIAKDTTGGIPADSLIPTINGRTIDKTANLHKAVIFLDSAAALDAEIGNLNELQNFLHFVSEAYEMLGDYEKALDYHTRSTITKDSIFSVENNLKIARLSEKREAELKQKKIEMDQLKIAAAKHEKLFYFIGVCILVVLSGGLFLRYRTTHKNRQILEEKNHIIELEKEHADMLRMRAERSERFKQEFLTNMSHEIRTPMNAVNGMTDLLLDKDPRPDQLHYLNVISRSSDILLHIINDILDLSKIEAGKLEIEKIDFSLTDVFRQVSDTLSFRAEEKGLLLTTGIDPTIPAVLVGDPFRLGQVLINLAGNAIKFTGTGTIDIHVEKVKAVDKTVSILFTVTDTGIGIPAGKLSTLFENVVQVQDTDSGVYGGAGLGLAIARQLVALQGGVLKVESTEGKGSRFYFGLTLPEGSADKLQHKAREDRKSDGSMLNGLRILLVDDNEYNRMVASETLHSRADVEVNEATNGREAIDMLLRKDYDVVLMDIQMPVMNGLDATRYIRTKLPAPKNAIPIIALTASLLPGDMVLCTEAGMNSFLPKPFKTWQLISILAEITGRKN